MLKPANTSRRETNWNLRERETDRQTDRDRQTLRQTETQTDRQIDRERHRQTDRDTHTENSNSKTLFYKDCGLGSVKNLSNN